MRNIIIKKILSYITVVISCGVFGSCQQENMILKGQTYPLKVTTDICGLSDPSTRAYRTNIGDKWSYEAGQSFQRGDKIGFYATKGNASSGNDGSQPFNNEMLEFNGTQFVSTGNGSIFSPTQMEGSPTLMYYPYDVNINDPGIELRVKPSEDNDTLRCIDFLSSTQLIILGSTNALYGSFKHAFSELIIMRGEGFDTPPNWTINVVMSQPVTHLKIETGEDGLSFNPKLWFDESTGLNEEEARKWTTWRGYNYGITENNDPEGEPAWYVIVPSLQSKYATVEYIELYDNDGYLQRVSSLSLHNKSKNVQPGWRYPLKIAMREMVPTVNPFPIMPWDQQVNLTDERTRGIANLIDFQNWVLLYNNYLVDPTNSSQQELLLKYGDKYIDKNGNIFWHFYLLNDIDMAGYEPLQYEKDGELVTPDKNVIIPEFHDILDGQSSQFEDGEFINYKLSNLAATFIGTLKPWNFNNECSVINIDFEEPEIIYPETNTVPAGIIANSMQNATVENCNIINGVLINPGGPAGMITGTMNGGTLKNCDITGLIIYKSTSTEENAKMIVGSNPVNGKIQNVSVAGVVTQ